MANLTCCGDITYIKTWDGWVINEHMRTSLVTEASDMALANRAPPRA